MIRQMNTQNSKITPELLGQSLIIDVRTPEEFREGAFQNAINIPLDIFDTHLDELKQMNKSIIVYCKSGYRSELAAKFLHAHDIDAYNGINQETLHTLTQAFGKFA